MGRDSYEVRTREKIGPFRWVKKSKFYRAKDSRDAASKYKGKGSIMSVQRVNKERLFGIGDFFTLGDTLLKEFSKGGGLLEEVTARNKEKVRKRRGYYDKQRKEATG